MKYIVQIFLSFIIIFVTGCDGKDKVSPIVQVDELIEVYVQISLIKDSGLGEFDQETLIDKYLSDKNLTREIIDSRLEIYRANPAEWRAFFMNVQSRLRELQREIREKTFEDVTEPLIEIVDTVIVPTIPPIVTTETDTGGLLTLVPESDTSIIPDPIGSSTSIEEDTVIKESLPSLNFSGGSYESDELGLFSYEIQPGDNLSTLAGLYDTQTEQLVIINGILSANSIRIGQKLLIPNKITNIIVHTIVSGEVLSKISSRYDSDLDQIARINKIDNMNAINIGDLLYIPIRKTETEGNE